ncbi:hypothetical protein IQ244_30790 [Nostoc sp. LEGE 06077]|nr:hypothetical protein [Nostoc sp. LEGE 06077]
MAITSLFNHVRSHFLLQLSLKAIALSYVCCHPKREQINLGWVERSQREQNQGFWTLGLYRKTLCYSKSADKLKYSIRLLLHYFQYRQIPVFN